MVWLGESSRIHPSGFEPETFGSVDRCDDPISLEKTSDSIDTRANAGAAKLNNAPSDSVLRVIIEAWPGLPEAIKAGILAIVTTATADSAKHNR